MAKGLGRGLNAFFGEDEENAIEQVTKKSSKTFQMTQTIFLKTMQKHFMMLKKITT